MINLAYSNKKVEVINKADLIMTLDNFAELVSYKNFDYVFNRNNSENLNAFMINECNYFLGITDNFGMHFLPNLDGLLDYRQGLLFSRPNALLWL